MAKNRKLRTAGFLNPQPKAKLPSPEEVNEIISEVTGKENETVKASKVENRVGEQSKKRVPLTTAITPENRARLEVSSINGKSSVADILNKALDLYFKEIAPVEDQELVKTFTTIYARKAK